MDQQPVLVFPGSPKMLVPPCPPIFICINPMSRVVFSSPPVNLIAALYYPAPFNLNPHAMRFFSTVVGFVTALAATNLVAAQVNSGSALKTNPGVGVAHGFANLDPTADSQPLLDVLATLKVSVNEAVQPLCEGLLLSLLVCPDLRVVDGDQKTITVDVIKAAQVKLAAAIQVAIDQCGHIQANVNLLISVTECVQIAVFISAIIQVRSSQLAHSSRARSPCHTDRCLRLREGHGRRPPGRARDPHQGHRVRRGSWYASLCRPLIRISSNLLSILVQLVLHISGPLAGTLTANIVAKLRLNVVLELLVNLKFNAVKDVCGI
jgi:hypothetical protein